MRLKKVIFTVLALLLLGGAGFAYWRMKGKTDEVPFVTTPVARGNRRSGGQEVQFEPPHTPDLLISCLKHPYS